METKEISMANSLRELPLGEGKKFPIKKRVSVISTIQRLKCEGYSIKTKTLINERLFVVTKINNPVETY